MKTTVKILSASVLAVALQNPVICARANKALIRADDSSASSAQIIQEPSGAELPSQFGPVKRATELFGTDVRNSQNEKLGEIKDFGIDVRSGRAPYTIISSGGFFGVGDRLIAVPTAAFENSAEKNFVLNMDRQQMKAAPSFDRNNWPEMSDPAWGKQIYAFYKQPYWNSMSAETAGRNAEISEPAGAEVSQPQVENSGKISERKNAELSTDRRPRQGLGAEDLTGSKRHDQTGDSIYESAGAEHAQTGANNSSASSSEITSSHWERANGNETSSENAPLQPPAKIWRASELIGTEVRNRQNERVGEIKDVVLDMKSGRVAYALLSAGGFLGMGDRLYAVPPSVFSSGADNRTLVLQTDKETLKAAPSFEKNNWSQSNNEQFAAEVYRYYHQQPYWQSAHDIREPAGGQHDINGSDIDDQNLSAPTGGSVEENKNQLQEDTSGAQKPNAELEEPAGAQQPEKNQKFPAGQSAQESSNIGTATKETAQLDASTNQNSSINEPSGTSSGVNSSVPIATSEDQGSNADRQLGKRVRNALRNDTTISSAAPTVHVSAANGRITLRGFVSSDEQREAIEKKVTTIVGGADKVDNQLQVKSNSSTP